ncbi:MAG: hypothetical protein WA555_07370 [Candidatus Sulfotelmatobacter sp.]
MAGICYINVRHAAETDLLLLGRHLCERFPVTDDKEKAVPVSNPGNGVARFVTAGTFAAHRHKLT